MRQYKLFPSSDEIMYITLVVSRRQSGLEIKEEVSQQSVREISKAVTRNTMLNKI